MAALGLLFQYPKRVTVSIALSNRLFDFADSIEDSSEWSCVKEGHWSSEYGVNERSMEIARCRHATKQQGKHSDE